MGASTSSSNGRGARPRRLGRGWRVPLFALVGIVALLLLIQFAGSSIATHQVNKRLADLPEYGGQVRRVHLVPWGTRVVAHDFLLWERGKEEAGPVVTAQRAELDLAFLPLLTGKVRGEVHVAAARVVTRRTGPPEKPPEDERAEKQAQTEKLGEVRRWQQVMRDSFPMELTRFELTGGTFRIEEETSQPASAVELTNVGVVLTGLRTQPAGDRRRPATGRLEAIVAGSGELQVTVEADPAAETPEFGAKMELTGLSLPDMRDFVRSAAKADVTSGIFEVYIEVEATGGGYQGYVKPFFRDLEFEPVRDPSQNVVKRVAGEVADAVTSLLKNEEEKVATRAPFQGNFADNEVDVWTTIENLLRNAFVQSLREGLEGQAGR